MFMGEKKRRAGFTLAEVLMVVAILAILASLAAPNVLAYYKELRLQSLDDSARSIFMAAQSRMTAMTDSGELKTLTPSGTVTASGDLPEGLQYLENDKLKLLLPGGSVEDGLWDGKIVVEYLKSGQIYGVWYSDGSFDYNDLAHGDRSREERLGRSDLVGYCGGGDTGTRLDGAAMPVPIVTLTNAEELVLTVTVPADAADGAVLTVRIGEREISGPVHAGDTVALVLDTLTPGRLYETGDPLSGKYSARFRDWGTGVAPGENFSVTVTLSGDKSAPSSVTVSDNSLFAGLTGDGTALIACERHLQNLDTATSGVNRSVTGAAQIREIACDPDREFIGIRNGDLQSYDGAGLAIRNGNFTGGGLFAEMNGGSLSHIVLVDCGAGGDDHVGALAGEVKGTDISGCRVYLEGEKSTRLTGGTYVGGLVGVAESCEITNCFASTVESGDTVGGLVGLARDDVKIRTSYAAGYLTGNKVGGLIGETDKTPAVADSYAAGEIEAAAVAAGICPDEIAVSSSYAAVVYVGTPGTVYAVAPGAADIPYIPQSGVTPANNSGKAQNTLTAAEMGGAWYGGANPSYAVFPYDLTGSAPLTPPYPYPQLKSGDLPLFHYGDWQISQKTENFLGYFYWEIEDGRYHFYALSWELDAQGKVIGGYKVLDNLCKEYDMKEITEYGYGVAYMGKNSHLNIDRQFDLCGDGDALKKEAMNFFGCSDTARIYTIKSLTLEGENSYIEVKTTISKDEPVYINPEFAAAISTEKNFSEYQIRTVRQLQNIGGVENDTTRYQNSTFKMTHDLNGEGQTIYPLYPYANGYCGTFDGQGHRIVDLSIQALNNRGALFLTTGANCVLKNIIMYSPNGTATITGTFSTAYASNTKFLRDEDSLNLAGFTADCHGSTTIENCVIANYTIRGDGTRPTKGNYYGGISAWHKGKITSCAAVVKIVDGSNAGRNSDKTYAGGIVGSTNDVVIRNSYSGGVMIYSGDGNIQCGGIVGKVEHSNTDAEISYCYTYMNMKSASKSALNIHAVCPKVDGSNGNFDDHVCFWENVFPSGGRDSGASEYTLEQFWEDDDDIGGVTQYVDGHEQPLSYGLPALVQVPVEYNGPSVYVHYGWWPKSNGDTYPY